MKAALSSRTSLFDDVDTSRLDKPIVLFSSEDLRKVQGGTDLLNDLGNYLPFVVLALFVVAILLSGNRRRTILRTALGIAFAMALLLIVFNLGRTIYLDSLPSTVNQDAASAVYDQVLTFLRTSLRTAFVVAIIVAIGVWLAGPGQLATRIRESVRGGRELAPGRDGVTACDVRVPLPERAAGPGHRDRARHPRRARRADPARGRGRSRYLWSLALSSSSCSVVTRGRRPRPPRASGGLSVAHSNFLRTRSLVANKPGIAGR